MRAAGGQQDSLAAAAFLQQPRPLARPTGSSWEMALAQRREQPFCCFVADIKREVMSKFT